MFCTSLRTRASFKSGISALTEAGIRESRLETHDIALPLILTADATNGVPTAARQLRFLLLSPSSVESAALDATLCRVQHFASLTGGQDLAIVFLQHAPSASFTSAEQMVDGTAGIHAYMSLQATLMNRSDIPYVPILPAATLATLPSVLKRYAASLAQEQPSRATAKPRTSFDMLRLCTAGPPMPQQAAYVLSDLFPNLRELAEACTSVSSAPASSSPSARAAAGLGMSSQDTEMLDMSTQDSMMGVNGRLKRLRDLVGQQQCVDLVDFWRDEWVIE